jgi:BRCT domain type II-containing protein
MLLHLSINIHTSVYTHYTVQMPEGADGCLEGAAFAITGQLDSLSRDAAEDMIKEYGGKVTTAVSGKTTYLLYGDVLEDGRPVADSK